jgi:Domain of unknown function (DUF4402)
MKWTAALIAMLLTGPANAQCLLCTPNLGNQPTTPQVPLTISVETTLDMGRAAHLSRNGAGNITIDPQTGARRVSGQLADLGGMAVQGMIRLTGAPFAAITISMPNRVQLNAPDGSTADIIDLKTNNGANVTLDAQGKLAVAFGGKLQVNGGSAGDFRGRIPVTADYR